MLTLLSQPIKKIVKVFYEEKHEQVHLRELSRRTNLKGPSITKTLQQLEQANILHSHKDGNLKKYQISNPANVFQLFDEERKNKLPKDKQRTIKQFLNRLPEQPVYTILFGSLAKNNATKESDIDLLIITNNTINTKQAQEEAEALTNNKVSVFQITYKEFLAEIKLKEDKVIQSAISTGFPITNNKQFYEDTL